MINSLNNPEIVNLQKAARNKAIQEGKNPDTLFALDESTVIDISGILAVLSFDGPEIAVQSIDAFIFEFLLVLSNATDSDLHKDT